LEHCLFKAAYFLFLLRTWYDPSLEYSQLYSLHGHEQGHSRGSTVDEHGRMGTGKDMLRLLGSSPADLAVAAAVMPLLSLHHRENSSSNSYFS